jgi:hypothetical protein
VPVSEYRSNLESMVAAARQAGISNILLLTPPPVHDEGRVKHQQQVNRKVLAALRPAGVVERRDYLKSPATVVPLLILPCSRANGMAGFGGVALFVGEVTVLCPQPCAAAFC